MTDMRHCVQVNMQKHFGGGEVYTAFLTRALLANGWKVTLFCHRQADFWGKLDLGNAELRAVDDGAEIQAALPEGPAVLLFHGPPARNLELPPGYQVVSIAHMPVYDRKVGGFRHADRVLGVSQHVLDSLLSKDIKHIHATPLLGVADLRSSNEAEVVYQNSRFDWDERKVRDRVFSVFEPGLRKLLPSKAFKADAALTLGIVSRITPIKQFAKLFQALAPELAKRPQVRLEIFGAGGYASIRDLRKALRPMTQKNPGQVRWWGHQSNVRAVYRQLDFLITGLPEKEALGLNVLEAQQVGLPVLAVNAPPFTETVLHEKSGFLYTDPREDNGAHFGAVLDELLQTSFVMDDAALVSHREQFTLDAFSKRMDTVLDDLWQECLLAGK